VHSNSYNADMLPDLLIEYTPGNRSVWLAQTKSSFVEMPIDGQQESLRIPGSGAFIDLGVEQSDYAAG